MFIQTFDGPTWEELWRDILISVIPTLNSAIPEIISDANKDVNKIETLASKVAPVLIQLEEELETIGRSPPVKAYEAFFAKKGRGRVDARLVANALIKLGVEHHAEVRAGRKLASAVGELAKNEAASPLVISRRAAALRHALNEPAAESCLQAGCYAAGVRETLDSLNEIIDQAMNRDGKACTRLIEISKALRPHLPNPRGRLPDVPSATHELFLHLQKQAYTYDPIKGDMADKATRATRTAMASPDFDPRPAWRRLKKRRRIHAYPVKTYTNYI
jgi:hypothetical protein